MGYDFLIKYKRGRENRAANALKATREGRGGINGWDHNVGHYVAPRPQGLIQSYLELSKLCQKLQQGQLEDQEFTLVNGLLLKRGRINLSKNALLKAHVLHYTHDSLFGGIRVIKRLFIESKQISIGLV